jgi:hypothetical protein
VEAICLGCEGVAYGLQLAAVFRRRACGQSVTGIAKLGFCLHSAGELRYGKWVLLF